MAEKIYTKSEQAVIDKVTEMNKPTYSSSLESVNPSTLFTDGYELTNQSVIQSTNYQGSFTPGINVCEFYIYDANKVLITSNYNFRGLTVPKNPNPKGNFDPQTGKTTYPTTRINLDPTRDIANEGFTFGEMYAVYNFINPELGSSVEVPYYLAEISSDRTEIRLKSNLINTRAMKRSVVALRNSLANPEFFDEIYISFGNNEYHIGINVKYDDSLINQESNSGPVSATNAVGQSSILIKLFDPLPSKYSLLDELYVCTKTAETQAYSVTFTNDFKDDDEIIKLKGPNSNLKIKDFVNAASDPKSESKLLSTQSSGSKDQLLNVLNQTGVQITPNYSTGSFGEFVNFSSAKSQVSNFAEKVARIQSYEADLNSISQTTGSNVGNIPISKSMASLWTKIEDEITAFSGFEYYQYYSTGSDAYPKTGTVFPFDLLPTQSLLANNWITAAEESGSLFDQDNQNWLYYTVPGFIKDNSSNDNYLEFVNMVGQSFDEVWLYTKAITERLNTTNDLDNGVPLQLADDVITSLGYTGFGNNYNNQDNFIGLIGNDNGNYLPPTGSEVINHYIAVNGPGGVVNYWEDGYSYEDYVESFQNLGFPYPIDKVSKEIFKRLYHNMSYLVKKKGTVAGLRQLINIWGIPNTILRINEFGGKNKDEEDDYDLWYQRYSYAYSPVPAGTNYASSSVRIPWQPLYRNYVHSHNQLLSTSEITAVGGPITGGSNGVSNSYGIDTQFTVTGGGSGGTLTITAAAGNVTKVILTQGDSGGYNVGSVITITGAQINNLNDPQLGSGWSGTSTFTLTDSNLGAEQIVPDGLGFRFKTTGYPSSSWGGNYDSQSLFIKKSTNPDTEADFGIVLNYTGSTSGSHLGSTSSKYVDYGEMRFFIKGTQAGGDTALSPPIYLPFFDKGWWNVQLQRDQHPIVTNNNENTTYTLYVANKIYDGADGNQIGFQGSASIYANINNGSPPAIGFPANVNSASLNESWNNFSLDLAQYGAGAYLGGWGNILTTGETGSMGILSDDGGSRTGNPKGITNAGKNFSGSFQEFRYYSHDISQSVFNDAVMNPESIEGNFITGSESSFDIVNFRAPLGNELEHKFTSSYSTQYIEQLESMHPAITGSSPLTITSSFWNPSSVPLLGGLTSSYDVTYNANSSTRTYSNPNVETYFLDQPSIGIRNRVSNKIKYSTENNFGTTLSNKVSIQQNPPISQSYTDNINSLEVAFSPTEEINDDIIQTLGYGSIQEVIADPRFRSSSDYNYPGLDAIAKDYFKKYTNRSQIDYLRLIKYFDDSLFRAIKNYVPARTSVSTGIVIKQNMLERSRYREPQVDIVTTQSYAPFNQPLTAKNLELTGSITTNQLWDPLLQTTYYSSSDVYNFEAGPGGSVNQYNILEEGGSLFILESDDLDTKYGTQSLFEAIPLEEVSKDIVLVNAGPIQNQASVSIRFGSNVNTVANGASDDDHSIKIISINPTDGSTITKKYCSSSGTTGVVDGAFIQWDGTGTATQKAQAFVDAINSANGQGSGSSQPTLIARVGANTNTAELIQLYGGTDGNTVVTYGAEMLTTFGTPLSFNTFSGGSTLTGGTQTGRTTNLAGLTVDVTISGGGSINNVVLNTVTAASQAAINSTILITNLSGATGTPSCNVASVNATILSSLNFSGGTSVFSNTFLNVDKSIQTPIYIDYDFKTTPPSPEGTTIIIEASSSIRGVVLTNQTTYTDNNPVGSILVDAEGVNQYLDIHPEEDMYLLISQPITATCKQTLTNTTVLAGTPITINTRVGTIKVGDIVRTTTPGATIGEGVTVTGGNLTSTIELSNPIFTVSPMDFTFTPSIQIDNYQVILGENIIITRALAAQTTTNSNTLLIDNLDPSDKLPVAGSVVTGPDIKAGVVTVLGAVTAAGTGYTPGTSVLATTGAGGGNLTLTVTANASGNVTTAALTGAANPGTNYTSGDVVTIVGGDNNAKVAITTASAKTCTVFSFTPSTNEVKFSQNQSVTNNSKVTFTVPNVIPDADTIPVSQQGGWNYNVTPLGIDTTWNSTQEQFYDGEYSGSDFSAGQYYNNQYNPYRKVKINSIPIAETNITLDTNNDPAAAKKNGLVISSNTIEGTFSFNATGGSNTTYPLPAFLGITKEELIPYQTYRVQCTIQLTSGFGSEVGIFYENYGYNGIEYNPYPGLIQSISSILSSGTGYIVGGGYQIAPSPMTVVDGGDGYEADTIYQTTGGNGAGQTIKVLTLTGTAINTLELVNPGSGYLPGDVLTVLGGTASDLATVNVGKGGVVIEITAVGANGTVAAADIIVQNGGNGTYEKDDAGQIIGGNGGTIVKMGTPASEAANGVEGDVTKPNAGVIIGTGLPVDLDFTFKFLPPLSGDTSENGRYGLSFFVKPLGLSLVAIGTLSELTVTGIGGIYSRVEAPIFLTQQDNGYDNQRDYQIMSFKDIQGNIIGGSPTIIGSVVGGINTPGIPTTAGSGYSTATDVATTTTGIGTGLTVDIVASNAVSAVSINATSYTAQANNYNVGDIITITGGNNDATFTILSTKGKIDLIQNTQSVIFDNSDYNPLSNNANINRSSSHRYVLSYGATQSCPNNFDLVVTQSYYPTSPSGTFPERADVPDSNYTMPSSVNSRYAGTKIKSLDYNFFTPSGSIGPGVQLPIQPLNRGLNPVGFKVANEFLDGSVTSSFQQTLFGAGSASWQGDGPLRGQSVIDKHPIYMARFENSYEQLNLYNSYQYNIDQLIEVPMEDIAGSEVTPNSITIDGSNENKKVVSSVFEPKRKVAVSYLNPKTPAIDYTTMQIGNYDILSGATEFLTLNSNAKSRVSASLLYNYTRGGQLVTSSLTQDQSTIQMVTGSNIIGNPETEGQLDTTTTLQFISAFDGVATFTSLAGGIPSPGGPAIPPSTTEFRTLQLSSEGGQGSGGEITVVFQNASSTNSNNGEVIANFASQDTGDIVTSGTGYIQGQIVSVTIAGNSGQTRGTSTNDLILNFVVASTNILTNPDLVISNGFILSGSLTTGNVPVIENSSLIPGTEISFIGAGAGGSAAGTQNPGTIVVPTTNFYISTVSSTFNERVEIAQGSGATVAITSDGTNATKLVIVNGGSGYRPGDALGISADVITDVNYQGGSTPIFSGNTSGILTSLISPLILEGESSPFQLNFNPSPISSSLITSSLGAGATSTLEQQLLIGGPQLALFNMFNTTVSSSLFDVNTIGSDLNKGPRSLLWTTSGSDPANTENYYSWAPESSDSNSYTNTNTPFTIERGDIIRVEGTLNTISPANISQSTNVIQDFTVEELQSFTYTSSFSNDYNFPQLKSTQLTSGNGWDNSSQGGVSTNGTYSNLAYPSYTATGNGVGAVLEIISTSGGFNIITFTSPGVSGLDSGIGVGYRAGDVFSFATGKIYAGSPSFQFTLTSDAFEPTPIGIVNTLGFQAVNGGAFSNTLTKGSISNILTAYQGKNRTFTCVINTDNSGAGAKMNLINSTTGSFQNVAGTVTAQIVCGTGGSSGIDSWSFTGGTNIPEGTSFSIEQQNIKNNTTGWGSGAGVTAFQFEMIDGCIVQQPSSNNFTFGVDVAASAESTPESGSQPGFHNYEKDEIGFTAPSFVRVTPDPTKTLVGLPGGEVTKMTIRRQIEADDKVMIKNIEPPSGSLGIETQSGQGFLIPNDFSPIQKANALNIINQLKAKNAFDKPNEPGITDRPNRINPGNSTNNPGGNSGGGGGGGIQ